MPATMKAVQIKGEKGDASALYIGEVDKPSPKPGQVLVKVRRALASVGFRRAQRRPGLTHLSS